MQTLPCDRKRNCSSRRRHHRNPDSVVEQRKKWLRPHFWAVLQQKKQRMIVNFSQVGAARRHYHCEEVCQCEEIVLIVHYLMGMLAAAAATLAVSIAPFVVT